MSDRTGKLCPICKKGKLYPSGKREVVEPATKPKSGETHGEFTEHECDNPDCRHRVKTHGIGEGETTTLTAEAKVTKKTKKKRRE
jgi:hypothetical protein